MQKHQIMPQVVSPADADGNVIRFPLADAKGRALAVEFFAEDSALRVAISLQDAHFSHLQDISLVSVPMGYSVDTEQDTNIKVWTDPNSDAYTQDISIPAYAGKAN